MTYMRGSDMPVQQGAWTDDLGEDVVTTELSELVDEGLLNMSIDTETGEAVYWPTAEGVVALGMV